MRELTFISVFLCDFSFKLG